jgi:hypothetical protein
MQSRAEMLNCVPKPLGHTRPIWPGGIGMGGQSIRPSTWHKVGALRVNSAKIIGSCSARQSLENNSHAVMAEL